MARFRRRRAFNFSQQWRTFHNAGTSTGGGGGATTEQYLLLLMHWTV